MADIVSFYTPDYEKVYNEYLGASLKELGLSASVHKSPLPRNWAAGCNYKPGIILSELEKGKSVLYIDSDAKVRTSRILDIDNIVPPEYMGACVFLNWREWYGFNFDQIEPLTGTLFFRPSAIPLVREWARLCKDSNAPDGVVFAKLIKAGSWDMYSLPIEWCYIDSLPGGGAGGIPCKSPMIIQYQASRKMRIQ